MTDKHIKPDGKIALSSLERIKDLELRIDILQESIEGLEVSLRVVMEQVLDGEISERALTLLHQWLERNEEGRIN